MNIFTEEILKTLQKGKTSTECINNAIGLIKLRNVSTTGIASLLLDIKENCASYKNLVWIKDNLEGFIYALEQELEFRNGNITTHKDPTNSYQPIFDETAQRFGEAFNICAEIYDRIISIDDTPFYDEVLYDNLINDTDEKLANLKFAYNDFIISLYNEIKDVTDWNTQDLYFNKALCYLPTRMFCGEFAQENYDQINKIQDTQLKSKSIAIIIYLKETTSWNNGIEKYTLRGFCQTYKMYILNLKLSELSNTIQPALMYFNCYLTGVNRYNNNDYITTDYSETDLKKGYNLLKKRYDELIALLQYYGAKEMLTTLSNSFLQYPLITQLIAKYKESQALMDIGNETENTVTVSTYEPIQACTININPQIINNAKGIVCQKLNGNINYNIEQELLTLFKKYGDIESIELEAALYQLKDKKTSAENKKDAKLKLKKFLHKAVDKIGDIAVTIFSKYIENQLF